jgi:polysaccharide biosynthesis protein PslG
VGSHWNEHAKYASMRAAGMQMIRMDIEWYQVQPAPGPFNWSNLDTAMAEAQRQNIQVLAVVSYTNDWASSGSGLPGDIHQYAPLESYDDEWGTFVQQAVSRYGDRVAAWEIWNETHHSNFLRMASGT